MPDIKKTTGDKATVTADQVSAAYAVLQRHSEAIEFMAEWQLRQVVREMLEAANGK